MANGFLGINIALSGIYSTQRLMGQVSHNISNAMTPGYARQVIDIQAYKPQVLPGTKGTVGTGVDVISARQIRDSYLDYKFRSETAMTKTWEARDSVLTEVQDIFNEPSDSSISQLLDNFYESLQTLKGNAENLTARTLVRENIIAISEATGRISDSLKSLQSDLNFQFKGAVGEVNDIAQQIAEMNRSIFKAELAGGDANDMRDQRNLLVDRLSEFVNVEYYEDSNNRFYVLVGGQQLVAHYRADSFELVPRKNKLHDDDDDGIMDVQWSNGNKLNVYDGKIKGLMAVRDNIEGDKKGIPYYVDQLNDFVTKVSEVFNNIHSSGFGLDQSTGYNMFTINNMTTTEFNDYLLNRGLNGLEAADVTTEILDGVSALPEDLQNGKIKENIEAVIAANPQYKGKTVYKMGDKYYVIDKIKASELTIAKDLENVNLIAASDNINEVPGDADNILALAQTRHDLDMFEWGSPEDFVKSLVSNLGVDAREAKITHQNQKLLLKEYHGARDSVMGVNMDEEAGNALKFQAAYSANARMVNVFDEMLDLLVNRLGLVGR